MNLGKLRAEEMEPLGNYKTALNDEGKVMIAVPGYFKGAAHDAVLLYGGGEDALLVRNPHQILICDAIHPEVRAHIPDHDLVLISEVDAAELTLDANNPMAGKDLVFDIEILSVN